MVTVKGLTPFLGLFLFLLIYDGALRRWAFPGVQQYLFIAKDALLFLVSIYIFFTIRGRSKNFVLPPSVQLLLLLYGAWVVLAATNTTLPNIAVGIWGIKSHLLYVSFIMLVPLAFGNLNTLLKTILKIYPFVVIPVCIIGLLQVVSPATSVLNQTITGNIEGLAFFGNSSLVRVYGTFSYVTGMAAFLQVVAIIGCGFYLFGVRSRPFLVSFVLVLAALPITGSRAVIVIFVISLLIMLLMALYAGLLDIGNIVKVLLALFIFIVISYLFHDDAWIALQERAAGAVGEQHRYLIAFTNAFYYFDIAGLFGFGSGSANLGAVGLANTAVPFSWLPMGGSFEAWSGRLVIEIGIIGWLLSQIMRLAIFLWAINLTANGISQNVKLAAVLAFPVVTIGMYMGNGVFAPPFTSSFYWFCVAILAMAQYENRRLQLIGTRRLHANKTVN